MLTSAFGAAGVWLSVQRYDTARDREVRDLDTTARANAADANRFLRDRLDLLVTVSAGREFASGDAAEVSRQLLGIRERHPEFDLGLAHMAGPTPVTAGLDPTVVAALTESAALTGLTEPVVITLAPERPAAIVLAAPGVSAGGGIVVAAISSSWLNGFTQSRRFGEEVDVFVLHEDEMIAGPADVDRSRRVDPSAFAEPAPDVDPPSGVAADTDGVLGDEASVVAYGVVAVPDWVIALQRARSSAFGDARRSMFLEMALLGAAAIVAIAGSVLVARRLDRAAVREHEISTTLQHQMLPAGVPTTPVAQIAARYEPAATDMEVGGDWWEATILDDGRMLLAVGDVVGRGLHAAAAVGQLRSQIVALAFEHHDPGEIMERLSRLAEREPAAQFSTATCVILSADARRLTYCNAGHPPPLLVHEDGATWLEGGGTPLAVGWRPYRSEGCDVTPGSLLVLYTDGLVERRGEVIDQGLRRLKDVAVEASAAVRTVEALADRVYEELTADSPHTDDVAIVIARTGEAAKQSGTHPSLSAPRS